MARAGGNSNEFRLAGVLSESLYDSTGRRYYVAPQVRQVKSETNQADYAAMLLDPDLPFEYHVFEVKVSRHDLARELANPRKLAAFDNDATFLWILADNRNVLSREAVNHLWHAGFGCAFVARDRVLQVHGPRRPSSFSDDYLFHENIRRRSQGLPSAPSDRDLRAYFQTRQWFPNQG